MSTRKYNKNKKLNKKRRNFNKTSRRHKIHDWRTAPEAAQIALMNTGSISKARENFRRQIAVNYNKILSGI